MSGLLILGAGGHGKVVAEAAATMQRWTKIAFLDDRYPDIRNCMSWPVVGKFSEANNYKYEYTDMAVALGKNDLRLHYVEQLLGHGINLPPIIHASAAISPSAKIEDGVVVFAQVAVNADTRIGSGCILNTGATIDHDCILGRGVHLSPGVHLGGSVNVGEMTWIGIGASVINDITLGSHVIIGAGAAVATDVPSSVTMVGVPARPVKK